jgi:methionyl-tRNA formyltransferase
LKITVLANQDLASNFALNYLIPSLAKRHRLRIFLSSRVGSAAPLCPELAQLQFFEQTLFNQLLFPALDKAASGSGLQTFRQLAENNDAPLSILNAVNAAPGLTDLAASEPDLILSIRYGGILREKAIATASKGVLNLHSGLLPGYRGVMATFYAMLNRESEIGTTLHYIRDAGIDTGEIIDCTRAPLQVEHSYLWNVLQLYPAGVALMLEAVQKISAGSAIASQPQNSDGHYYSFPDAQLLERFGNLGYRLYDVDEVTSLATHYLDSKP